MGTPMEDAAYQRALNEYRVFCEATGQMPDPAHLDQLALAFNQVEPGMVSTPPAVPGAGKPTVPGAAAPATAPPTQAPTDWSQLRYLAPHLSDEQWDALVVQMESMGLNVQTGFAWIELAVQTGTDVYIADLGYEVGMANAEAAKIANEIAAAQQASTEAHQQGLLEEMGLSREQEAVLSRELNTLNKYIAEMQNQVSTLGLQIQERAYGAQLGAHPVHTVEFEFWQRAGGSTAPVEIPEAPVPQAPEVPSVPTAQRGLSVYSPKGNIPVGTPAKKTAPPGELHTVGEKGEWEYLHPGPGTVVAPRAQGETKPTQAGGQRAISRQLASVSAYRPPTSGGGKRVPYGWMKRREALGFQGGSVPSMQGGGLFPAEGTHTDEEMAAWLASAIQGWPHLYNPNLRGTGQFGSVIPGPQEMSRRRYYSMDPSQQARLTSFLEGGLQMPSGAMSQGIAEDWLRQVQRSWIPGLEGAKKSVSYAY